MRQIAPLQMSASGFYAVAPHRKSEELINIMRNKKQRRPRDRFRADRLWLYATISGDIRDVLVSVSAQSRWWVPVVLWMMTGPSS